jgi:hypothetical protein
MINLFVIYLFIVKIDIEEAQGIVQSAGDHTSLRLLV